MKWWAKIIKHQEESRIAVYFEKDEASITRIKQLEGARWSSSKKVWHLPDNEENRIRFQIAIKQELSIEHKKHSQKFKNWLNSKR